MERILFSEILEEIGHSLINPYKKALRIHERYDKTRYVYLLAYENCWSYIYGVKLTQIEYDWLITSLKKRQRFSFYQGDGKIIFVEWKSKDNITIISHYQDKTCKIIYNRYVINKLINFYPTYNHILCNSLISQ